MEWMDIETAPKDGTEVLLWMNGWDTPYTGAYHDCWWIADTWPMEWTEILDPYGPTHWMPLPPSPPAAKGKVEG